MEEILKTIKVNELGYPEVSYNRLYDGLWYNIYYKAHIVFSKYYKKDDLICFRFKEDKPSYPDCGGDWIEYDFEEKRFKVVITNPIGLKTYYVNIENCKFKKRLDQQFDWLLKLLIDKGYKDDADFIEKEIHKESINKSK